MEKELKIYCTKNYSIFKFLKGNRNIDITKKNRLKEAMCKKFIINPIKVNENMEILDGQHRFMAAKESEKPIYYYISENEGINEARTINKNMTSWKSWDYVESYALENSEYKKLCELPRIFPEITQKNFFIISAKDSFARTKRTDKTDIIKDGLFKFKNYNDTIKRIKQILDYKIIDGIDYTNFYFISAIWKITRSKKYNHKRMIDRLKNRPKISPRATVSEYIDVLQEKYNYNLNKKNHLYFDDIDAYIKK